MRKELQRMIRVTTYKMFPVLLSLHPPYMFPFIFRQTQHHPRWFFSDLIPNLYVSAESARKTKKDIETSSPSEVTIFT